MMRRFRHRRSAWWAWVASIATVCSLHAEVPPTQPEGHLHGTIADESGAVVPAAKVVLTSSNHTYSTLTSAVGIYDLDLPIGIYEMNVAKPGFCYQRALFRMPAAPLTINAHIPTCAIAQVATIGDGVSSVHDELRPSFSKEEASIPEQETPQLKLLITYRNRQEDADITTYSGYSFPGASGKVVVTYDCLTVSAKKVRFDHHALRLYAEDDVTIEDGKQSSTGDFVTVRFEKGKAIVQFN